MPLNLLKAIAAGKGYEELGITKGQYSSRKKLLADFCAEYELRDLDRKFPQWLVTYNHVQDKAFTAQGNDVKSKPSVYQQAKNLVTDCTEHVSNGRLKVSDNVHRDRMLICRDCSSLGTSGVWKNRCQICGCFMQKKTKWKIAKCPLDKWKE